MESPHELDSKISATAKIFALLAALISYAASVPAHAVVIDGRDWRQPLESTSLSYDDVSSVCDIISGSCSGTLYNGALNIDFSGWTWAGATDIAQLFASLTGKPESTYYAPSNGFLDDPGEAWALAAIDIDRNGSDTGLFHYTDIRVDQNGRTGYTVQGLTRNLVSPGNVNRSYLGDGIASQAITNNPVGTDQPRPWTGIWLYREVPVPSTHLLTLLGLAALFRSRAQGNTGYGCQS